MTTTELSEQMRSMSIRMEILSIEMRDAADGDDDMFHHSCELHGASLMMKSWAKEVELK